LSPHSQVQQHYSSPNLLIRIQSALREAGLDEGLLDWSQLAPLDQFHLRGLPATRELAESLRPEPGQSILDIGAGLGGPARYLAATYHGRVTGIDLTPNFASIANYLSLRTGLAARFLPADALHMPFAGDSFDHAWTQHAAMNIPDKPRLYREVHRVLKPGGRFAIYDVLRGETEPVIYPVPWARDASLSFLAMPAEVSEALRDAGFIELSSADTSSLSLDWLDRQPAVPPAPLNISLVTGPETPHLLGNVARNLRERRIRLFQIVVSKSPV
jgi:SAM-dependent methyltransferase